MPPTKDGAFEWCVGCPPRYAPLPVLIGGGFDVFEKKITEIKKIARNARGSLLLFVIGSVLVKYEPILRF